jgi:SAM-dependent methyltransferase
VAVAQISELSRQYVKLCEREDFDSPEFLSILEEIVPDLPSARLIHRKHWEYAMLGLYLTEVGALTEQSEALAVAAGHEETLYWLANRVGRVVATDIYGQGSFGEREAAASMLGDASAFAPVEYRKDHLEVREMNALDLRFPDDTFDIVYSLSSIEHFGGLTGAAQGVREMARTLRSGGHLLITTECLVGRHVLDLAPVQFAIRLATMGRRCAQATPRRRATEVFTPAELVKHIVRSSGLELVQALDLEVSDQSFENLARMGPDGQPMTSSGSVFPHIMLRAFGAPWTSVFLALRKR